jgi:hypothetical protein
MAAPTGAPMVIKKEYLKELAMLRLDEERRKPGDKSIDECVCHDQSGSADDQPGEKLRSEEGRESTAGVGRKRHGGPG